MESVTLEKQIQKVDRVILDAESIAVIQKISNQIQNALGDLVQLSQKDVVNFLIQERSSELTVTEINKIKNDHFDIVRALKRATQEAIRAKQDGLEIQMDELLKIIQTPSVNKNVPPKKVRGHKKKQDARSAIQRENTDLISNSEALKQALNDKVEIQIIESKLENLQTFTSSISP